MTCTSFLQIKSQIRYCCANILSKLHSHETYDEETLALVSCMKNNALTML
jgi:hypothetical protein